MRRLLACLLALAASCGHDDDVAISAPVSLSFALPVDCASPPSDLDAVAWVSGTRRPFELDVDIAAGTTSGSFEVTTGAERRVVIDWFVERGGTRVLLGQAVKTLDVTAPESAEPIELVIAPEDVEVVSCVDVTDDVSRQGSPTTTYQGAPRPACDLDDSCGGSLAPACANLGELCAGEDPLT